MKSSCLVVTIGVAVLGMVGCANPSEELPDPLADIIPDEMIHQAAELDVRPQVMQREGSLYAPTLAKDGTRALVTFEFVVSSSGMVHSVRVLRSTHLDASNQILEVLPRWTFSPGVIAGQPVASRVVKSLSFSPDAPAIPTTF